VEFAFVLPLLALLLVAVVDVGRGFHHYIVITNAAREGARRASRYPDQDAIIRSAVVGEAANSGVDLVEGGNVEISINGFGGDRGDPISVSVHYTYTTLIGGLVGLPEIPMANRTEMAVVHYIDESN
jgi:hypothetical protein